MVGGVGARCLARCIGGVRLLLHHLPVGLRSEAERFHAAVEPCGDSQAMGGVVVDQQRPVTRQETSEGGEGFHDGIERAVAVQMIFFDVEDDGVGGVQVMERAVEFARLGDEDVAFAGA